MKLNMEKSLPNQGNQLLNTKKEEPLEQTTPKKPRPIVVLAVTFQTAEKEVRAILEGLEAIVKPKMEKKTTLENLQIEEKVNLKVEETQPTQVNQTKVVTHPIKEALNKEATQTKVVLPNREVPLNKERVLVTEVALEAEAVHKIEAIPNKDQERVTQNRKHLLKEAAPNQEAKEVTLSKHQEKVIQNKTQVKEALKVEVTLKREAPPKIEEAHKIEATPSKEEEILKEEILKANKEKHKEDLKVEVLVEADQPRTEEAPVEEEMMAKSITTKIINMMGHLITRTTAQLALMKMIATTRDNIINKMLARRVKRRRCQWEPLRKEETLSLEITKEISS